MSTESIIAIRDFGGDRVEYVTCHYGGGRELGRILVENYGSVDLAEGLVNLGDLSGVGHLGIDAPEGHTWAKPVEGYTVAYHRDRGEPLKIRRAKQADDLLRNDNVRWVFLFDCEEDKWVYARTGDFMFHTIPDMD